MNLRGCIVSLLTAAVVVIVVVVVGVGNGDRSSDTPPTLREAAAALHTPPKPLSPAVVAKAGRAFAGQSDRAAARTVRQKFGGVMGSPGWPDLRADPRVRVNRVLRGGHDAIVTVDGRRAQVRSMLPLTVRGADGKARPVSTKLRSERGSLVAQNVPSDYRLNRSLGTTGASVPAVSFPRAGFTLSPGTGATAQVVSGKAFWGNVRRDTDFIATPLPTGVQVLWQLRSADSPERLDLGFGGVDEVRMGDGDAARLVRDGRRVGSLTPPRAWDADGRPVDVSWRATGSSLVLDVDHRGTSVRHPVLVDPLVADDQRYWVFNAAMDFEGWQFSGNTTYVNGAKGFGAYGNGLNLGVLARASGIPQGTIGRYDFKARAYPGPFANEGAHIFKADFGNTAAFVSGLSASCWQEGILGNNGLAEPNGRYRGGQVTDAYTAYPLVPNTNIHLPFFSCSNEGTPGQSLTYGYRVHCLSTCGLEGGNPTLGTPGNTATLTINPALPGSFGAFVYMGSSLIFQSEQHPPKIQTNAIPSGWVDTQSINASGVDYGLGTRNVSASAPGWTGATLPPPACLNAGPAEGGNPGDSHIGDRNHRCNQTETITFNTASMPEGAYPVTITARDIVDNSGSATVPVKIDRTAPTLTISGALKDAEGGFARDGDSARIVATDAHSGVRSLDIKIDGTSQGAASTCATDGCSLTRDVTLDTDVFGEGEHTVLVTALDGANHTNTSSWTFSVDETNPVVSASGPLAGGDGAILVEDLYTLEAYGDDQPGRGGVRSGIRSLTIRVDPDTAPPDADHRFVFTNPTCQRNSCSTPLELTEPFEYVASRYGAGDHVVTVTAEDAVGNTAVDEMSFNTPHAAPLPAQTLSTAEGSDLLVDGANPGDRLGASLANVGDINGDGRDDLLAGAPGADIAGQADAGAAYLIYGSNDTSPISLGGADPRVVRLTFNQAGANAGAAVAAGGDVNGDGQMDLLIGAPGSSLLGLAPVQGRVWAIFGGSGLPAEINLAALGTRGFEIRGPLLSGALIPPLLSPTATSTFGGQIATRRMGDYEVDGDVNGDGRDDIVLGAGNATSPALTGGVAYVIFGREQTGTIDLSQSSGDPGANGFRVYGTKSTLNLLDPGQAGTSTTIIGDVNGDELAEIVVTDPGQHAAGRVNAGTAYVIFGRQATSAINLANLGSAGYQVIGRTNDAVATAASPGDIDGDGRPDLLLGGHGAFVHFAKSDTSTQDLNGTFDGYRLDPPTGAGFERATVAGVGDQDGDQAADTLIGFPRADNDRGIAYLAYGKIGTARIDLGTLRGDQGTRIDGGPSTRAASASEGTDVSGSGGVGASVVAAPNASGQRGQLRNVPNSRLAQSARTDKFRCATRGTPPAFPFVDASQPSPFCRRALRNTIDIPISGDKRKAFNARPRCGLYSPNTKCFPSAFRNGNSRNRRSLLAQSGVRYPVYDSFGPQGTSPRNSPRASGPIGFVEQAYPGCFNIYNGANTFQNSTDADVTKRRVPCNPAEPTSQPTIIEYQGRGCMATRSLEDDFIVMRVLGDALQGFVSLAAVPVAPGTDRNGRGVPDGTPNVAGGLRTRDFADLQDAYQGCGRKRPRQRPLDAATRAPADVQLRKADNFIVLPDPSAPFPFLDQYVSPVVFDGVNPNDPFPPGFDGCVTETDAALRNAICTGFSGAYQGACWAPDVAAITSSTTYVSGVGTTRRNNPSNVRAGGLVRGFIRRDAGPDTFAPYDKMGYLDNNVPVALGPHAHWVFGNAHPGASAINATVKAGADADDREQSMFGWSAIRQPNVAPARYTC